MSDETNRSRGLCGTCGLKKHIHQKRDGKPICAACLGRARTAAAAASKGTRGKEMQCAAAATIAIEKWVELTSDPDLKEELELLLEKISVLNVVASGGVTAAEYDLAVDSVEVNPFADDTVQEPLNVEFDAEHAPRNDDSVGVGEEAAIDHEGRTAASQATSGGDPYEAARRDAVSPHRDAEFAPSHATTGAGTAPSESPKVVEPAADQTVVATLVGLSDECREELLEDMDFTPSEVNKVRVPPGLGAGAEMEEALRQLEEQREQ